MKIYYIKSIKRLAYEDGIPLLTILLYNEKKKNGECRILTFTHKTIIWIEYRLHTPMNCTKLTNGKNWPPTIMRPSNISVFLSS